MADPIYLVQSDTLPQIKLILTDEITEGPLDLSGATVALHAKPQTGVGISFSRPAIFIDEPADRLAGICYIQWQNGDLNRSPGKYDAEIEILYPTGWRETVYDKLVLDIREDIGDIGGGYPTGTAPGIGLPGAASTVPTQNIPTVDITPSTLPSGTVGVAYNSAVSGTGAGAPYNYSVTVGTLPIGLNLTSSGALSGIPTTAGNYTFTITADNTEEYVGSRGYTVVISA